MIKAEGVSLIYSNGTKALNGVDLVIGKGELVFIIGSSGSGKTSLLKLLMGIEQPTVGTLTVLGQSMNKSNVRIVRKLRRSIGPVFQEFGLIKGRTALDNVMIGMGFLGISPRVRRESAKKALIKVGLDNKIDEIIDNLSWGEAQRVAIARAIARKPSIIIADEPTGNLDHDNAIHIFELLAGFCDEDTTVIITTHATHLIHDYKNATYIQVDKGTIHVTRSKNVELEVDNEVLSV